MPLKLGSRQWTDNKLMWIWA